MGWEDIQEMPTANLREELLTLLKKEVEYGIGESNSAENGPLSGGDADADESTDIFRCKICQWGYECVDYVLFDRELVCLSMHYFDRYLTSWQAKNASRRPTTGLCHLLALSSLYLACKLHGIGPSPSHTSSSDHASSGSESDRARLRLREFWNLSRGGYCPQMLEDMEMSLLTTLKWKLHPPTPADFLFRFVKILSMTLNDDPRRQSANGNACEGASAFELARYQVELGVYSAELCKNFAPSKVALAALLNAMDSKIVRTNRTIIPPRTRHSFLGNMREYLGEGFAQRDVDGERMVRARTILKNLCKSTVVLPGHGADRPPASSDNSFQPIAAESNSFEYELPEVQSGSSSTVSPVSVAAEHF